MNLIVNAYPKKDTQSLGMILADHLASRLGKKTHTINIYESEQGYFNYQFNQEWIDLIVKSSTVILPVPMWNFMVPAALKDFFDKVIKRGQLWDLDKNGKFTGLLSDRPAYIIMTSGGDYPAGSPEDFIVPYLRTVLAFIGIKNVRDFRIGSVKNTAKLTADKNYLDEKTRQMFEEFGL